MQVNRNLSANHEESGAWFAALCLMRTAQLTGQMGNYPVSKSHPLPVSTSAQKVVGCKTAV